MALEVPRVLKNRTLKGIVEIDYTFENLTGLLIRAPGAKLVIGGADVMPMSTRRKYDNEIVDVPYIPGSSIKGRMRSLLESLLAKEVYSPDKRIYQHYFDLEKGFCLDVKCPIDNIFGCNSFQLGRAESIAMENPGMAETIKSIVENFAPTRIIVTDAFPSKACIERLRREKEEETGIRTLMLDDFLEEKAENRIDRITSAADPRTFLRVKPHIEFEGKILYKIIHVDMDVDYLKYVFYGLKLIEDTYLGGCGSRGYGRIRFNVVRIRVKPAKYYKGEGGIVEIGEFKASGEKTAIDVVLEKLSEILSKIKDAVKS